MNPMQPTIDQRLTRSPVLPATGALLLLAKAQPFAEGNTVALVVLLCLGFWLTYSFSRFSKAGGFIGWLAGR